MASEKPQSGQGAAASGSPGISASRPVVRGRRMMASSCHYLATAAAFRILNLGGNAADAAAAGGLVINVVEPHNTNLGGVAPVIWASATGEVKTIDGLGVWPRRASIDYFVKQHAGDMPAGIPRTIAPAALDSWVTLVSRFGTLPFGVVAQPAIELADGGFPVSAQIAAAIAASAEKLAAWPSSADVYLNAGRPRVAGELFRQPALAATLRAMCDAEKAVKGDRQAGLKAARDRFYRGDIAGSMTAFLRQHNSLLDGEDLAAFAVQVEAPIVVDYAGNNVAVCGPWTQGPMLAQALRLIETYDLDNFEHNSADYLHVLTEIVDLCFADREAYYGDPNFVDVPMHRLTSREYAQERRRLISMGHAFDGMPPCGRIGDAPARTAAAASAAAWTRDTSYICVMDADGNAVSATPSDPAFTSPLVPELGIIVSSRGSQSWLNPAHPSSLVPGKRPRLTPAPGMLLDKQMRPIMPFGAPGGDGINQAMLQFLLNVTHFDMDIQDAIEAPRAISANAPNSFWPHGYLKNRLNCESRLGDNVLDDLRARGHDVVAWPPVAAHACSVCAVSRDPQTGTLSGGSDIRTDSSVLGW